MNGQQEEPMGERAAVEAYPGQFDEMPLFPPRVSRESGIPQWLRVARPEWYRTGSGPVLHVTGERELSVRSVEDGWMVSLDGLETPVPTFDALLEALEGIGEQLLATIPRRAADDQLKVTTGLELGFAADLLWWCTHEVVPSINGLLFEDWYDAPATYLDTSGGQDPDPWEFIDDLHWDLDDGDSMTGAYGTMDVWRIGARFVGRNDDIDCTVGAYTGPEVAIDYFQEQTSPDDWERYGLIDPDDGEDPDESTGVAGPDGSGS